MNLIRTFMLLSAMTALFMSVGFVLGGLGGMLLALLFAAATNLFSWWKSDKMVLAMHRAVEVDEANAPEYYAIVKALVARAELPMPAVYLIDNAQPNAFATGRNPHNAAVAVTTGLLNRLSQEEAAGVIAHELAHIKNRDTLTMTITATLAGAISMLGNFAFFFGGNRDRGGPLGGVATLLAVLIAPLAAMIVQMAISRTREYAADRLGAEICGHPLWLASALRKIATASSGIMNESAERNPASAHLFIINPLNGLRMDGLFSTHPATEHRIAELEAMAGEMANVEYTGQTSENPLEESAEMPEIDEATDDESAPPSTRPWGRNASQPRGPWS